MTSYETAEIAAAIMANFLSTFTIYMSIITAYVVTAFVAGNRLNALQLAIVNGCFLASTLLIGFLSINIYQRATALVLSNLEAIPTATTPVDLTWLILGLYCVLLVGGFAFMYSVRTAKSAQDGAAPSPPAQA